MEVKTIRKELECLFAWSQFYQENKLFSEFDKVQDQIEAFKDKHNIE